MIASTTGYRAIAKNLPISPSKIHPIARLIRYKSYADADALLRTLPHKAARFLLKTLRSAAANAMDLNKNIDEENLHIQEILVGEGARHKRIWARGRGRADRQLKRYAHVAIVLGQK